MSHSIRRRSNAPARDRGEQHFAGDNVTVAPSARNLATAEAGCSDVALERHYTIGELSKRWHSDYKTVRRMFEGEPGVLTWGPGERCHKRSHISMRIPESVVIRVHRKHRMCRNPQ
jgi:hypothetical protein